MYKSEKTDVSECVFLGLSWTHYKDFSAKLGSYAFKAVQEIQDEGIGQMSVIKSKGGMIFL